RRVQLLN
ncbi:unnamed protein product, partial [Allacma fusca]